MSTQHPRFVPPFCPRVRCRHHRCPAGWRWRRQGAYSRKAAPRRIPRFLCLHCGRSFSSQTFSTTYYLKKPRIQRQVLLRLVECGALRQIGRGLGVAASTVQRQTSRLGRHCLLFQAVHAPRELPDEDLVLDGFRTFEYSHYWPCDLNLLVGSRSHFLHGFSEAELRRSGRMTDAQKRKRSRLEALHGLPDPRATEKSVRALLGDVVPEGREVVLWTDEHQDYGRAVTALPEHRIRHLRISSKAARTPSNPLHPVNHADLLVRHSSANHKRETIAFSKRRQGALERLAVFQVWRNFMKGLSERDPSRPTPAMKLGLVRRRLRAWQVLARRLFPSQVSLPARVRRYYERRVATRQVPGGTVHVARHAF